MSKPQLIVALAIGILSTLFAAILWTPLALGYQVAQYSEFNQATAIFEFTCVLLGLLYLIYCLIKLLRN